HGPVVGALREGQRRARESQGGQRRPGEAPEVPQCVLVHGGHQLSVTPAFLIVTSMSGITGSSSFSSKSPLNSVGLGALRRPAALTVTPMLSLAPQMVPPALA